MSAIEMITSHQTWRDIPAVADLISDANHVDVKQFEGEVRLRQFLASMLSYNPGWIKFLYHVRGGFVRLLGMKQDGIPQMDRIKPEEIAMTPGDQAAFFEVKAAEEDHFYIAGATESHLTAHLIVVREPINEQLNRFYVITVVHYHRWTGPVYFNVIRPFHHIVVEQMGQAGVSLP